jgi:hypothetical protein
MLSSGAVDPPTMSYMQGLLSSSRFFWQWPGILMHSACVTIFVLSTYIMALQQAGASGVWGLPQTLVRAW